MTSESGTLFFWLVLACVASITSALGILGEPTSSLVTARQASPSIGLAPGGRGSTVALLPLRFTPSQCFATNPSALCHMIEGC